jgi:hypothetical protein
MEYAGAQKYLLYITNIINMSDLGKELTIRTGCVRRLLKEHRSYVQEI